MRKLMMVLGLAVVVPLAAAAALAAEGQLSRR